MAGDPGLRALHHKFIIDNRRDHANDRGKRNLRITIGRRDVSHHRPESGTRSERVCLKNYETSGKYQKYMKSSGNNRSAELEDGNDEVSIHSSAEKKWRNQEGD